MVAVRNQLRELQHPIEATSTLRGDNQSSLLVATTPGKHRSSLRHLELHAFQVKDFVDNGEIDVVWCPGDDCIADVYEIQAVFIATTGRWPDYDRESARRQRHPQLRRQPRPQRQERLSWGDVCVGGVSNTRHKLLCPGCACPGDKGTGTSQARQPGTLQAASAAWHQITRATLRPEGAQAERLSSLRRLLCPLLTHLPGMPYIRYTAAPLLHALLAACPVAATLLPAVPCPGTRGPSLRIACAAGAAACLCQCPLISPL